MTKTQLSTLQDLVRYCMVRIDSLEKRVNPIMSRETSLDPRPVVLGPSIDRSISERSEGAYTILGVPPGDLSRLDSNNSVAENMVASAAVMPPGPPRLLRNLSETVEKIKGEPPTFERLSSSDGVSMLRLNTQDLALLMDTNLENEDEGDVETPSKKRRREN
jgi:hypothetical protein